jgi:hypothetical protein
MALPETVNGSASFIVADIRYGSENVAAILCGSKNVARIILRFARA